MMYLWNDFVPERVARFNETLLNCTARTIVKTNLETPVLQSASAEWKNNTECMICLFSPTSCKIH